jgi:hypothetical protein
VASSFWNSARLSSLTLSNPLIASSCLARYVNLSRLSYSIRRRQRGPMVLDCVDPSPRVVAKACLGFADRDDPWCPWAVCWWACGRFSVRRSSKAVKGRSHCAYYETEGEGGGGRESLANTTARVEAAFARNRAVYVAAGGTRHSRASLFEQFLI